MDVIPYPWSLGYEREGSFQLQAKQSTVAKFLGLEYSAAVHHMSVNPLPLPVIQFRL